VALRALHVHMYLNEMVKAGKGTTLLRSLSLSFNPISFRHQDMKESIWVEIQDKEMKDQVTILGLTRWTHFNMEIHFDV